MNAKMEGVFERLKTMLRDGSLRTDIFERQCEQKLAHIELLTEDAPIEWGSDCLAPARDFGGRDYETSHVD